MVQLFIYVEMKKGLKNDFATIMYNIGKTFH